MPRTSPRKVLQAHRRAHHHPAQGTADRGTDRARPDRGRRAGWRPSCQWGPSPVLLEQLHEGGGRSCAGARPRLALLGTVPGRCGPGGAGPRRPGAQWPSMPAEAVGRQVDPHHSGAGRGRRRAPPGTRAAAGTTGCCRCAPRSPYLRHPHPEGWYRAAADGGACWPWTPSSRPGGSCWLPARRHAVTGLSPRRRRRRGLTHRRPVHSAEATCGPPAADLVARGSPWTRRPPQHLAEPHDPEEVVALALPSGPTRQALLAGPEPPRSCCGGSTATSWWPSACGGTAVLVAMASACQCCDPAQRGRVLVASRDQSGRSRRPGRPQLDRRFRPGSPVTVDLTEQAVGNQPLLEKGTYRRPR